MAWSKYIIILFIAFIFVSCSISLKMDSGSINYDLTKTIQIADFPNRTPFYSPMAPIFNQALRKRFIEQTRLKEVPFNADIELEGEITNFEETNLAAKQDGYASQARLTITVRVEYVNNKQAGKDISQSFSASQEFPSTSSISDVQDNLVKLIIDEIVDMIYNATVANW